MSNREHRIEQASVHVLMGLARPCHGETAKCIRIVDKGHGHELRALEAELKAIGGYWRVHRTVNARDCEKARKWLISRLVYHPEKAGYIDSEWRTALLQPENIFGQKKFMFDIDTKDEEKLKTIRDIIVLQKSELLEAHESPKGWHYITLPFDTRRICEDKDVTLIRDGYHFVKEIGIREE